MSDELVTQVNTTTLNWTMPESKTSKRATSKSKNSSMIPSCASLSAIPPKATTPSTTLLSPAPSVQRPFTTSSFSFSYSCPKKSLIDLRKSAAREKCLNDMTLLNAVKANYRFIYRINDGARTTNTILQKVCEERGWREFQEASLFSGTPYERAMRGATGWNLWWSYSIYQFSPYKYLRHWQYTNHNPKGFQFCNKLYLTMYLRKMKAIHGNIYDFYPLSYIIPDDFLRLSMEHSRRAIESFTQFNFCNLLGNCPTVDGKPPLPPIPSINPIPNRAMARARTSLQQQKPTTPTPGSPQNCSQIDYRFFPVWISKPVAQSQGKGIFLTTDLSTIASNKKSVVQEYISRPLLIGGYKWDIRIYVCVSAIDPLVIYIYHEGLCRFCTEKYNTTDLTQVYSHLTNASLNKLSPAYEKDKELIGHGCKWPLKRLRQYFRDRKINDWLMWQKIMAMVVLTVIGDSLRLGYSASNRNCFDLFGFDVLIDEDMKPWLLECNYSPGLGEDCETDILVKKPMLHELFDLLGFPDKASYEEQERKVKKGLRGTGETENLDEMAIIDKDEVTRHYFDMVLNRLQTAAEIEKEKKKDANWGWRPEQFHSAEDRLLDAKSIYSQNLVVQYLKNQSTGKISKHARDQLISVATKKLRSKMTQLGGSLGTTAIALGKEKDSNRKGRVMHADGDAKDEKNNNNNEESDSEQTMSMEGKDHDMEDNSNASSATSSTKQIKQESTITITVGPFNEQPAKPKKADPYRIPDSEAFQKLKYYFDAGVDYPLDAKTGKFREFPALLTSKKDWFNPTKQEGGWVRVYPFDARTTKSPYKSSLTDVRQAVRAIENYLKTAEHVSALNPTETDDFYRRRMKTVCRRDTEIWIPPLGKNVSLSTTEDDGCSCSSMATQASDGWAPSLTENE